MGSLKALAGVVVGVIASSTTWAIEPYSNGNMSPPIAVRGGPFWQVAGMESGRTKIAVTNTWASHFAVGEEGGERLIIDGETWRTTFRVRHRFGGWLAGLDVPYLHHSGGVLDTFIDAWHKGLGLPQGGRNRRPSDNMEFSYRRDGNQLLDLASTQHGVGDLRLGLGRVLGSNGELLLWAALKLPTGDGNRLTGAGSGGISVALTKRGEGHWWGRSSAWYWGFGLSRQNDGDLAAWRPNDWTAHGLVGGALKILPRIHFKTQLETSTPPYDSELRALGSPSLQLTLGADIDLGDFGRVELAVAEDLVVDASPDVAFNFNLTIFF